MYAPWCYLQGRCVLTSCLIANSTGYSFASSAFINWARELVVQLFLDTRWPQITDRPAEISQMLKQGLIGIKTTLVVSTAHANFLEREQEKPLLSLGAATGIDQNEVPLFKG